MIQFKKIEDDGDEHKKINKLKELLLYMECN